MEILRLNTHGIVMAHFSRILIIIFLLLLFQKFSVFYSSPLNKQVSLTDNSSIYTFNVSRFDNQIKYECQISNQALTKPLQVEKYLHIKCKFIS
jgi:hypothetical protein